MRRPRSSGLSQKPPVSPKALAVRWLARREYGRAELRARLIARGCGVDEVDRVLDDLVRGGYLSDVRCAEAVVAGQAGRYARRAIARTLKERGIDAVAAAQALAPLAARDEFVEAMALWRRRFGVAPANEREKARQWRFLLSRGYPPSVALKVLREAGAAIDDG